MTRDSTLRRQVVETARRMNALGIQKLDEYVARAAPRGGHGRRCSTAHASRA